MENAASTLSTLICARLSPPRRIRARSSRVAGASGRSPRTPPIGTPAADVVKAERSRKTGLIHSRVASSSTKRHDQCSVSSFSATPPSNPPRCCNVQHQEGATDAPCARARSVPSLRQWWRRSRDRGRSVLAGRATWSILVLQRRNGAICADSRTGERSADSRWVAFTAIHSTSVGRRRACGFLHRCAEVAYQRAFQLQFTWKLRERGRTPPPS